MSHNIHKDEIDHLLFEVAKQYKKICRNHSEPVMMVIVGGGSILLNHNFRNTSYDIDSLIYGNSAFKEAIKDVANKNDLPYDWINSDFETTESYSQDLAKVAKLHKTFCNVLSVYVVDDEYLVAMKLRAFRSYKHDKSDIVGVLKDMHDEGKSTDISVFERAYFKLYKENMPKEPYEFLSDQLKSNKFLSTYEQVEKKEKDIGVQLKPLSKAIRDSVQVNNAIEAIEKRILEERIIKELGADNGCEDIFSAYEEYLLEKFRAQNSETDYNKFLKDELKDDYDIFIKTIVNEDKSKR